MRVIGFGKAAEPMYPTTAAPYEAIYVSDRLNNGMWILDPMAVDVVSPDKFIGFDSTKCNGLFHSCKADNGKYVGNVCNGSNSLSFINLITKDVTYVDLNEKSNENCQPHGKLLLHIVRDICLLLPLTHPTYLLLLVRHCPNNRWHRVCI